MAGDVAKETLLALTREPFAGQSEGVSNCGAKNAPRDGAGESGQRFHIA